MPTRRLPKLAFRLSGRTRHRADAGGVTQGVFLEERSVDAALIDELQRARLDDGTACRREPFQLHRRSARGGRWYHTGYPVNHSRDG